MELMKTPTYYWNRYFRNRNEDQLILRLSEAFRLSWSQETAYPSDASNWTTRFPSLGQCAVTALIVHDELGGKIHKNAEFRHYWNQLPSGAIVDFTKDQFDTKQAIVSQGTVSKVDLLQGQRAVEANTRQRYILLNNRVKKTLKQVKPTLFLLSSNAQPEYIQDIIEAIGLPEGTIHHFRYSVNYLDPLLKETIPFQGTKIPKSLKGTRVVVTYLNQTRVATRNYRWDHALPVRSGILKDCYKTGAGDNATAHFYFELEEGLLPCDSFGDELRRIFANDYEKRYALFTFSKPATFLIEDSPSRIFEEQCDAFRSAGLTYRDLEKEDETKYDPPLMVLIEGLYKKRLILRDKKLRPKYDSSTNRSYYKLIEATPYYIKYRTLSFETKIARRVKMTLPKDSFSGPSTYTQNIRSHYYSECWDIVPAYVEHGTRGYFEFATITLKKDDASPADLDCQIYITYQTKRRMLLRFLDTTIDLLFAAGPTYLVATKILEHPDQNPWYVEDWPIIILTIYGIWFIAKLVRNTIRGK